MTDKDRKFWALAIRAIGHTILSSAKMITDDSTRNIGSARTQLENTLKEMEEIYE